VAKKLAGLFADGQSPVEAPPSSSGGEGDRLLSDEGRAQLEAAAKKAAAATATSVVAGARKSLDLAKRAGEQIKRRLEKAHEPAAIRVPDELAPVAPGLPRKTIQRLPKGKPIELKVRVPRWPLALLVIGALGASGGGAWYFTRPKVQAKVPVLVTISPAQAAAIVVKPAVQPLASAPTPPPTQSPVTAAVTAPASTPTANAVPDPVVAPASTPTATAVPDPVVVTAPIAAQAVEPTRSAAIPARRSVVAPRVGRPSSTPRVEQTQPDETQLQLEKIDAYEKQHLGYLTQFGRPNVRTSHHKEKMNEP
jgi:hypothetical protein